jgi:hypothetical protein
MAVFTEFPFFRDGRPRSFPFDPACFKERLMALFNRPFPHGLRVTNFSAAVEFFKDESASSVYVYNPRTHKFFSVATSD